MGCKSYTNGAAVALIAFAAGAYAAPAAAKDCAALSNATERLQCYDERNTAKATPAAAPASIEVRMVDASDLFIGSRKYLDQEIGLRAVKCYYADVGDYRCSPDGGTLLTVFARTVEPQEAQEFIEKNCDTLKKLSARTCLMNIRFRYSETDTKLDVVSGYQERRVIRPKDGISIVFAKETVKKSRR